MEQKINRKIENWKIRNWIGNLKRGNFYFPSKKVLGLFLVLGILVLSIFMVLAGVSEYATYSSAYGGAQL